MRSLPQSPYQHSQAGFRRPRPSSFKGMCSLPFGTLLIVALVQFSSPLRPALADDGQAVVTDGHGAALWWSADRSTRLQTAEGTSWELALEPDVQWTSLAIQPGSWTVAGRQGENHLVLMQGQGNQVETLSAPRQSGNMVGTAVLLADRREVQGLAWLEGNAPRELAVRAAMRRPDGWTVSSVISPAGPGTQTALVATVLSDGHHLLLWSAFDGKDDEIRWSIGREGSWSRPSRLGPDNRYPDITPAVTAMADGQALAAWSSYDGRTYRLVLSHFDDREWGPRFSQPASADLFPSFTSVGSHKILQARDALENHWTLVNLGPRGEALQSAIAHGKNGFVSAVSEESIEFRTQALSDPERLDWAQ